MKTATTKTLRLIGFAVAAFAVIGLSLLNARWATSAQAAGATVTVTIPQPEIFWVDPDIVEIETEADLSIVGWNLLDPNNPDAAPVVWANKGTPNPVELEVWDWYVDEYGDDVVEVYADGSEFAVDGPLTLTVYSAADVDMTAPVETVIYVIDWDNINTLYLDVWQDDDISQGYPGEVGATVYYWGEAQDTVDATVWFFDVNPETDPTATPFASTTVTVDSYGQEDTDVVTYDFPMTDTFVIYGKVTGPNGLDTFPFDDYAQAKIELSADAPADEAELPTIDDYGIEPAPGASMPSADPKGTTNPTVTVRIDATDPDGFPIYQQLVGLKRFSSSSRQWELIGAPKWYNADDNLIEVYLGVPGTTTLKGGTYYIVPFVADVNGHERGLTDTTKLTYVNLYANGEVFKENTTRVFRVWADMGQTINFSVTTSAGDVDAYLYVDNAGTSVQVISDTTTAGGASITAVAPTTGTYQIEVVNTKDDAGTAPDAVISGYGQATVSGASAKVDGKALTAPNAKVLRTAPVAPPSEQPSLRTAIPQAGKATLTSIFLPVIRR